MYKIWSAIENVFSKMRKYPVPTKEEAEELKRLRQEAGMTIPQVAEALHTNQARISDYENGKRGTDPELIEKLKKRYKLIIQYNAQRGLNMNIIEAVKEVFNLYKDFNKKIEEEEIKENE